MSVAGLPMYDLPELAVATAAFWRGLARHLRRVGVADAPDALLAAPSLADHWLAADLLFSQTCGYPLVHALKDRVRLVATPCYAAPGCDGASYCSVIVVPRDSPAAMLGDLRGGRAAFNAPDSQSGFNALRAAVAPLAQAGRFFGKAIETGSHAASLALVADGGADLAALDCVSFALFQRCGRPATTRVRVLARTASVPALPYVTALATDDERLRQLRQALRAAIADPALAAAREALLLRDIMLLPESAYDPILDMERAAIAAGYPRLD